MKVLSVIFLVALSSLGAGLQAQDIRLSQFYAAPLNLNPAMTGLFEENVRIMGNMKLQMNSVLGNKAAFKTALLSADYRKDVGRDDFIGLGISILGDQAGTLNYSTVYPKLTFAYNRKMGGNRHNAQFLSFGVGFGLINERFSLSELQLPDDFTNEGYQGTSGLQNNIAKTAITQPDIGAGLLYYATWGKPVKKSFYAGLAASHLNKTDKSFIDGNSSLLHTKYIFHAGGEKRFNSKWKVSPRMVLLYQNPHIESNLGLKLNYYSRGRNDNKSIAFGTWFRMAHSVDGFRPEAIIFSSHFNVNAFEFGLSYDLLLSKMNRYNINGGSELSMKYALELKISEKITCPDF